MIVNPYEQYDEYDLILMERRKRKKIILSLVLSFVILFTIFSIMAYSYAEEKNQSYSDQIYNTDKGREDFFPNLVE